MTGLSVIVLVGNEELHIRRSLERLAPLETKDIAPWAVVGGNPARFIKNREIEASK